MTEHLIQRNTLFAKVGQTTGGYPIAVDVRRRWRTLIKRLLLDLGSTCLDSLVTTESVERLGLEKGLRAWAMIKTVAIGKDAVEPDHLPEPRRCPLGDKRDRAKR